MGDRALPAKTMELIHAACEGSLQDKRVAELEQVLLESPHASQLFMAMMDLEMELGEYCQEKRALRDVLQVTSNGLTPTVGFNEHEAQRGWLSRKIHRVAELSSRPTPLSLTIAALVVGVIVAAMEFIAAPFYSGSDRHEHAQHGDGMNPAAQLTGEHEAVWTPGNTGNVVGAHLVGGHRMELQEGLAEVTFSSGAKVVIEGPARLRIDGRNNCTLNSGKLVGRVPAMAVGFSIKTPNCEVVDLGTEFGVSVTAQRSGVQVFEGSVAVVSKSGGTKRRQVLVAGEARVFDESGLVLQTDQQDVVTFRRQLPKAPQFVDITPVFVGTENYGRQMYAAVRRAKEDANLQNYDAAVGKPAGNQFVWLDLSDALAQLPARDIERVILRCKGEVAPRGVPFHGQKPVVEAELGIFPVPDDKRGVPTIFARGDGQDNAKFYAAHASEVIDTVTVPAVGEEQPLLATWDITKLFQYWLDNPDAPRRGQLIIINRQHPVWVKWDGTPRVYARMRSNGQSDAAGTDELRPLRKSPQGSLEP